MLPRGDGPFQVPERINNNAYKLDFPGEYTVIATFNVTDLSPFDAGDNLRTNPFQEEGNDGSRAKEGSVDPLEVSLGPMTRDKAKRFKKPFMFYSEMPTWKKITCSTPKRKQRWSTSSN